MNIQWITYECGPFFFVINGTIVLIKPEIVKVK